MARRSKKQVFQQPPAPLAPVPNVHRDKLVTHPDWGVGKITEVTRDGKWCVVVFEERTLTFNIEMNKFLNEKG